MSTPTMAELLATIESLDDFLKSELGSRNILLQTNIDPSAGVCYLSGPLKASP